MEKETVESVEKVVNALKMINDIVLELKETNMKIIDNLQEINELRYGMEKELIALQAVEQRDGNFKN